MSDLTLIIGNKNYSSWSMRPWLALKHTGAPFREVRIPLYTPESKPQILAYSPSGKVPALRDGDLTVWDSLAVCEYLAERFPQTRLWPADPAARAVARSICAEMHAGFQELRKNMSMNIRRALPGRGMTPEVARDIERIKQIWRDCRKAYGRGGPFLFGGFTIADAFYAPVVLRFRTYAVEADPETRAYMDAILAWPAVQEWIKDGEAETEVIEAFEPRP